MKNRVAVSLDDLDQSVKAEILPRNYWYVPSSEGTLAPYSGSPQETSELVDRALTHNYFEYFIDDAQAPG